MSPGTLFGEEGSGFMRMNIGAPRRVIEAALENIRKAHRQKEWLSASERYMGYRSGLYSSNVMHARCIPVVAGLQLSAIICIWTGFILVTRHSGTGTLTSWDIAVAAFRCGRADCGLFFAANSAAATQGNRAVFIFRRHRLCYYRVCRVSHDAGGSCFCAAARHVAFCNGALSHGCGLARNP